MLGNRRSRRQKAEGEGNAISVTGCAVATPTASTSHLVLCYIEHFELLNALPRSVSSLSVMAQKLATNSVARAAAVADKFADNEQQQQQQREKEWEWEVGRQEAEGSRLGAVSLPF